MKCNNNNIIYFYRAPKSSIVLYENREKCKNI